MANVKAKHALLYDVHPGVAMMQKWVAELKTKTGRTLDEWITLVKKEGPKNEKSRRDWLKNAHNLGTNSAWWIAERAEGKGGEDSDPEAYLEAASEYVAQQYAGSKEKLRPIYDALLAMAKELGPDVKACPCKTIVPLYREHVFAQIKPTTNTRIDLGLCLIGCEGKLSKCIVDTGGLAKKDRITHRIPLQSAAEVDAEIRKWLQTAYRLDG